MKKTIYKLLVMVFAMLLGIAGTNTVSAQQKGKNISATVVDEQGNPLEGVKIFAPGGVSATTGNDGKFSITVKKLQSIVIEKEGFGSETVSLSSLTGEITLTQMPFLASESDAIKMGIQTKYKRDITGAVSSVNTKDRMVYDNTEWVKDYIQGLMPGVKGSNNIRGLGNALFVIDGVIGRDPDILNMDEVEQITVLKDASAVALYGNQAKNGVIVINTKRGLKNRKTASVNIRYGIKDPISLPQYLGAAQYMELYNEAKQNDGADPYYDPALIEAYKNNSNPYRYPDVDLYSGEYLRDFANTANILTEFSGGNDKTQYYVNMGWKYDQSLVKLNPDVNKGSNRFNVRGNIDFKVNDFIKSSIDVVAIISSDKTSRNNILNDATTFLPNSYAPLLPVSMIDVTDNDELKGLLEAAGKYDGMLLGGSQVYKDNIPPIAHVIAGGYNNAMFRSTQFNNAIDFDLGMITKGLSAKTYLSFDFYDAYDLTIKNDYKVYEPQWDGDSITGLTPYGDVDRKNQDENVSTKDFTTRLGFYGMLNYDRTFGKHSINSTLLGYASSYKQNEVIQTDQNAHVALQLAYDYDKKFFAEFTGTYINSIKLPEGNRGGFSPAFGLGYILSKDEFMKDIEFIDFLKLKASGGILKSDLGIADYYMYSETYQNGSWFGWNDGGESWRNREKDISQGANYNMTFEERQDLNIGFESILWNAMWLEFNYYNTNIDKQLTTLDNRYPSFYDVFKPYDNYDKDNYQGFELGLDYSKKINDFSYKIGGNILYTKTKVVKRDEIFENDYQYKTGQPVNTIYGLVDDGFYSQADFTTNADGSLSLKENLPVPSYGAVQPGDIKYIDLNNDGTIDNNDRKHIAQSVNPWAYGVNIKLSYKNVSLFVMGLGQSGGYANKSDDYYWVDKNDKYSEIVLDRWTPETANTATFPRLTANVANNNYRTSTFWMYNNSFFDIKRAQLTYEFSDAVCNKLKMQNLSINVAGVNLFEFAENKDVRQLNIGGNPQFRYYSVGLRTTF